MHTHVPIPFFEFRGPGAPPGDVGGPGDVFLDTANAWVSEATVRRRREPEEPGLALAAQIIRAYLTGGVSSPSPTRPRRRAARGVGGVNDASDSDSDSGLDADADGDADSGSVSDTAFYPSKKARRLESASAPLPAANRSPTQRRADPDIARLGKERSALEARRAELRARQQELLASGADQTAERARGILQRLEKEYIKYRSLSSLTEAEFAEHIVDVRSRLAAAKASLQAKELERAEIERQTAERVKILSERRKKQEDGDFDSLILVHILYLGPILGTISYRHLAGLLRVS
ncbi:hypothetical protein B0H17DRAFT_1203100 [Mycena rosella]|uniref:Uncharacterized protein n=1 Tax=Mycena rosella TaxID=1033263 RepID=A0AAD7GGT5_MYCRO|nr:hypothetical protein B0H17DRAFT_1203100 [Mycena rosella]